ncbi:LOW QUALITY PROTEIN: uncharacterized protein SPEM3 [Onychomys torridus]|uniref:LOW QUALITY PROTEIN: uncharacterized protein SPEM3 n=1 Tax=Onychomys torridus TaxID=38674 RepID=UPI00167FCA0C|nr:LOW QUALITY PROTEIN: uncharacterized protein SPEM3 [Onychomys torridus]
MGEQVYHGAQACSGTNLRKCQDLGDSILLILGSFILLNVGINVVTLLWKHLKNSLRILFHHFFPKDKQPADLNGRPLCMRCTADPKNLYSRISSRFPRRPSFLLGHANHFDSWVPDTNDENISRCCWMPPQCGHGRAPTEVPWELWKEGPLGAGEAPQATVMKTQDSLFSKPEISPQIPKIHKLNTVPPSSSQEDKTKAPDDSPPHAQAQALTYSLTNTHEIPSTQSQTQTSEPTQYRAQGLEHTSAYTPPAHAPDFVSAPIPDLSEAPVPASASPPTPSHNPAPTPSYLPAQAPTHNQAHILDQAQPHILPHITLQVPAPTQAQGLAHSPEQASAHTLPRPPTQAPAHASFQSPGHDPVQILVHTLTHPQTNVPEQTSQASTHVPSHSLLHLYDRIPLPSLTPAPGPHPAFAPAPIPASTPSPALALSMTMITTQTSAQVPVTTSTPTLPPVPSMLATFDPSFSTGHMVYDARRVKQNAFLKHNAENSGYFRKDLNILSRPQEVKGMVNSEETQKQHGGESAEPPAGPILGYLELGNMDWKISDNAKDKFSQPKTFPYHSLHPCCSESKGEDSQAPVYPKFLVYTQNATPSQPCLHTPSAAQSTLPTTPPLCTLALPLVSPRTFAGPQSNPQKPSNLPQTPTFLSTSKPPQTVSSPYFSVPSQFSTISQNLIQPPNPENQNLNQGFGLQKTPSLDKESRVPRNPGLTQDPGLQKNPSLVPNPGLQKNPGLTQDPGLQKNPSLVPNPGLQKNPGLTQDPGLQKNPGLTQDSGLQKNPSLTPNPGLQKNPGLNQDPGLQKNPGLTQDSGLQKSPSLAPNPGLQKNPDLTPNPGLQKNPGLTQDLRLQKNPGLTQDPGLTLNPCLHKNSGFYKFPGYTQNPYLCMNPNISQDPCLQKNLGTTPDSGLRSSVAIQDAGVLRNLGFIQPSNLHKNIIFSQTSGQKTLSFMQDSVVYRNGTLTQDTVINKNKGLSPVGDQKWPDSSHNSGGNNGSRNVQHPGTCRNVGLSQDSRPQKNPCHTQDSEINKNSGLIQESSSPKSPGHVQISYLHKSSGFTQDSGDYKNLGLTQNPGIYRVPDLNQDTNSHKNPHLINVTTAERRSDLNQDVGIYSSEHGQDPNLQECPAINQDSSHHQNPALGQGSGFKTPGLTQQVGPYKDSGLTPDSDINKKTSFAPGTGSAQVLGPLQILKLASSPVKSLVCKTNSQKDNTEQQVSSTSVPVNQGSCPSKAQVLSPDLKTLSEVPVLIELQPPSRRLDSQDWVYHTVDNVPSACQKYRQMSMPPKINWKPQCPGPGTRTGHVVFDSRQKQLLTGREKCEALSPRRSRQEALKNSRRPRRNGDIKM